MNGSGGVILSHFYNHTLTEYFHSSVLNKPDDDLSLIHLLNIYRWNDSQEVH